MSRDDRGVRSRSQDHSPEDGTAPDCPLALVLTSPIAHRSFDLRTDPERRHRDARDGLHSRSVPLADAPLQQFVPLLVENAARNQLHGEGLHCATN